MGWVTKHLNLCEGGHSGQEAIGAETGKSAKEHDVQVIYTWDQDTSQWSDSEYGSDLIPYENDPEPKQAARQWQEYQRVRKCCETD